MQVTAGFKNQISIHVGPKQVKIFSNGRINTTGCKTLQEACRVASSVASTLSWDLQDGECTVEDVNVLLINFKWRLSRKVDLRSLHGFLAQRAPEMVHYIPQKYAGLRIVGLHKLAIFGSGVVMFLGMKDADCLREAADFVACILESFE